MSAIKGSDRPQKRRRTVRKGTHSCWACKRRKEKCERTNNELSSYVCRGCERRGTRCVGQEYPEDQSNDGQEEASQGFEPAGTQHLDDTFAVLSRSLPTAADLKLLWNARPYTPLCCSELIGHSSPSAILDIDFSTVEAMLEGDHSREAEPQSVARILLQIAVFLQNIELSSLQRMTSFSEPTDRIVDSCVKAAIFLMSKHEEELDEFEGLQCVVLESMYRISSGHLRLGWLCVRKAILVAQAMGLPLEAGNRPSNLRLPAFAMTNIELDGLWSHISRQDLLLSRILGLHPGVFETSFSDREQDTELERLEDLHYNIMARLAKYRLLMYRPPEFEKIALIDQELQTAAKSMAKDWWLIPDLMDQCTATSGVPCNTRRLIVQMIHFDLRARLYIPHMCNRASRGDMQQQTYVAWETCIGASREVMSRCVLLRTCRPVESGLQIPDFLGVMAAVTLLLGHLCKSSTRCSASEEFGMSSNDRIMIIQMLANVQRLQSKSREASVQRCIILIKHLLDIQTSGDRHDCENDLADRGTEHQSSRSKVAAPSPGASGISQPAWRSDCNPYFGAIDMLVNKSSVQGLDKQKSGTETTSLTGMEEQESHKDSLDSLPVEFRHFLTSMYGVDMAFVGKLADSWVP